jgi:intraflagellar transport protein 140
MEAEKVLVKVGSSVTIMKHKQELISLFLQAKSEKNDTEACESICAMLLNEPDINSVVRMGDILGLLIESSYAVGDLEKARGILKQLKARLSTGFNIEYYIDGDILRALSDSTDNSEIQEGFIDEDIDQ